MDAFTVEFEVVNIKAEDKESAIDRIMENIISGWVPKIFNIRKGTDEYPPTKKMLWALHCITRADTRKCNLSFDEVSSLIAMSKRNGGDKTKKQIAELYVEWELEKEKEYLRH